MDHTINHITTSFLASIVAETFTLPLDVAKVRLQVNSTQFQYNGMFHCMYKIQQKEGIQSLWKGLYPALLRQCCYNTMTMVLYDPLLVYINRSLNMDNYLTKILSAGISSSFAIFTFNWTEVIKTNIQTNTKQVNIISTTKNIYNNYGLTRFWYGWKPNIARSFITNGVGLGSYKQIREICLPYYGDTPFTYLISSFLSGFISCVIATPFDVIKTRQMDCNSLGNSKSISTMISNEGFLSLYKGFMPICYRRVLWSSSFFLTYEFLYKCLNNIKYL